MSGIESSGKLSNEYEKWNPNVTVGEVEDSLKAADKALPEKERRYMEQYTKLQESFNELVKSANKLAEEIQEMKVIHMTMSLDLGAKNPIVQAMKDDVLKEYKKWQEMRGKIDALVEQVKQLTVDQKFSLN